jgi:p-hydroxybenzoate 3-monooxygenase
MTPPLRESTTVAIVGGGVSGLTAAALLRSCGIDSIVLERQTRAHVEQRQRAGLVEHRAVRMFEQWGLGDVLQGFPANNFLEIRVDGRSRLLAEDLPGLETAGKTVPQQALVRGLIAALLADGGDLRFEVLDAGLHQLGTSRPVVTYTDQDGLAHEIECDFVAGCDGERGFAAQFARGPKASRFYLHCPQGDTVADWPHDRIWAELKFRLHDPDLPAGPITGTEVFPLRSSIREPMSYGRLYLLGDSAHIIPPMGAKGMNLALFDAEVFAAAVRDFTATGDDSALRAYSGTCLARTWRYQEYSNWLAEMVHGASGSPVGGGSSFRERIMRARLERLLSSGIAARYYAEMFTGLG